MLQQPSTRQYPHARLAAQFCKSATPPAPYLPTANHILAALPREEYERLLPDLDPVLLPSGWIVHAAGAPERYLYFLTAGIVSRLYVTTDGAMANFAVTGNEGAVGVASFLGGDSMPSQTMVLSDGHAYRLKTGRLKRELAHGGALLNLLLRYTLALITLAGQTAMCNRHHTVQQQLCLWILSCLDRAPSNTLAMTQECIANLLGVRREGITVAASNLQNDGVIRYRRGRIVLLNRARLEAQACECYAVVKRQYDRLLCTDCTPEFGATSQ